MGQTMKDLMTTTTVLESLSDLSRTRTEAPLTNLVYLSPSAIRDRPDTHNDSKGAVDYADVVSGDKRVSSSSDVGEVAEQRGTEQTV